MEELLGLVVTLHISLVSLVYEIISSPSYSVPEFRASGLAVEAVPIQNLWTS